MFQQRLSRNLLMIITVILTAYCRAGNDDSTTKACRSAKIHIENLIAASLDYETIREGMRKTCAELGNKNTRDLLEACLDSIHPDCNQALDTLRKQLDIDEQEDENSFFKRCLHIEKLCDTTKTSSNA